MENLKVIEATEAYLEQDTSEGRKMVMRIVLPQLNNEEQIEFINDCIAGVNDKLKTLCTSRKLKSAMDNFTQVFVRQTVLKMAMAICLLFICFSGFSQNFKTVDKFGKTKQQIADTCAVVAWCDVSNTFHGWPADGEPVDIYRSLDFAIVMFVYNKEGLCYKIIIKNSNPVIFDKPYKVSQYRENGRDVYIVQK